MDASGSGPKLRLATQESADELALRYAREQRAANLQRESNLENSLAPFRVGSVRYLNAVPLTRGLEHEVVFATPSQLAAAQFFSSVGKSQSLPQLYVTRPKRIGWSSAVDGAKKPGFSKKPGFWQVTD